MIIAVIVGIILGIGLGILFDAVREANCPNMVIDNENQTIHCR